MPELNELQDDDLLPKSPVEEDPHKFQQKFLFVQNDDTAESRKEVLSHSTREYFRKRRWMRKRSNSQQTSGVSVRTRSDGASSLAMPKKAHHNEKEDARIAAEASHIYHQYTEPWKEQEGNAHATRPLVDSPTEWSALADARAFEIYPQTTPGPWLPSESVDPFNNFPVKLDRAGREVMHYFNQIMPNYLFRLDKNATWSLPRDHILRGASKSPAMFYAVLAIASSSRDGVRGVNESPETLRWRLKNVQAINEALQDPVRRLSDGLLGAVVGAVRTEHHLERRSSFAVHCRGFTQILRSRGGWASLRHNPPLETSLIALQLIFSKRQVDVLLEDLTDDNGVMFPDVAELRHDVQELSDLLRDLLLWEEDERTMSQGHLPKDRQSAHDRRVAMFGRDSFMLQLLGSPLLIVAPTQTQIEVEQSNLLFCLLFFATVLWSYRELPVDCVRFINRLSDVVHDANVSSTLTRSRMVFPLLTMADIKPEIRWLSVRMVKVAHLLGEDTTKLLQQYLLEILDPTNAEYRVAPLLTEEIITWIEEEALAKLLNPG